MKRIVSSFILVMLTLVLFAGERTREQAARLAAEFVNQQASIHQRATAPRTAASMRLAHTGMQPDGQKAAYYVFNQGQDGGAVFVSADDRAETILGYTEQGDFDYETANPNLRWWLGRYTRQMAALPDDATVTAREQAQAYTPIAPLLGNIEYDQEKPYYNLCPKQSGKYCLTGCVATAAAQVMRKWKHPQQGTGSHSYKPETIGGTLTVNFANTTYDWDNILEQYQGSYTSAQATAIATLMYHCGVACDMDYTKNGSGAYTDDMAYGLVHYFGYTVEKFVTQYSQRDYGTANYSPAEYNVTTAKMAEYFHQDLEAGRPVILGGADATEGGHEFVCDGRDSNGKFHINWGWSGEDNGYFAITGLTPTGYDFSSDLDAIIGLQPMVVDTVHVESVTVSPSTLTLKINEKQALQATILPANATIRNAVWSTSDATVVSVNNGMVRALKQGTATITATAENKQATCTVTVTNEVATSDAFVLATDISDLAIGDEVIIVNEDQQKALSTTQNPNNRAAVSVTINEHTIELDDNSDAAVFTLAAGSLANTYAFSGDDGYLYAASSKKNYLRTQTKLTADASWSISIDNGTATIEAQGSNTHNLIQFNNGYNLFSAYLNKQAAVSLYVRSQSPTTAVYDIITEPAKAVKRLQNGRLVILRDGRYYNALGQTVR